MLVPALHSATAAVPSFATAVVPSFANACAQLAPPMSVLLLSAPLLTIGSVERSQSVGSLPLLPYSSMAANCALWTAYGFLKKEAAILGPNLVGVVLALYYMKSFIKFSPPKASTLPGSVKQHVGGVGITLGAALLAGLTKFRPEFIGFTAVLFCIAMFASPLASLKEVIATKSAKPIPLPFTIASIANCFLWTITGVVKLKDSNVIIPNALGLLCGITQVALKVIYSERRREKPTYSMATP